jgi:hypothetical protein
MVGEPSVAMPIWNRRGAAARRLLSTENRNTMKSDGTLACEGFCARGHGEACLFLHS